MKKTARFILLPFMILICTAVIAVSAVSFNAEYIDVHDKIYGEISKSNQSDVYCFELDNAGTVTVEFECDASVNCTFYGENDKKLVAFTGVSDKKLSAALSEGTYCFEVKYKTGYGSYSADFNFDDADESFSENTNSNNNSSASADSITFDKNYSGFLALDDTVDFYSVDIPEDGTLTVEIDTDTKLNCTVYNNKNKQVKKYTGITGDISKKLILSEGTYFIKFESTGNYGEYEFSVEFEKENNTEIQISMSDAETSLEKGDNFRFSGSVSTSCEDGIDSIYIDIVKKNNPLYGIRFFSDDDISAKSFSLKNLKGNEADKEYITAGSEISGYNSNGKYTTLELDNGTEWYVIITAKDYDGNSIELKKSLRIEGTSSYNEKPEVELTANPSNGIYSGGSVTFTGRVTDDTDITNVKILLDGTVIERLDTYGKSAQLSARIDLDSLGQGSHTVKCTAADSDGDEGYDFYTFRIERENDSSTEQDEEDPVINITASPELDVYTTETVTFIAYITDDVSLDYAEIYVDSIRSKTQYINGSASDISANVSTKNLENGRHYIKVFAKDKEGNAVSKKYYFEVYRDESVRDYTKPTVSYIISPNLNVYTDEDIEITAEFKDDEKLATAEIYLNSRLIAEKSATGKKITLEAEIETEDLDEGNYSICLYAIDTSGNETYNYISFTVKSADSMVTIYAPDGRTAKIPKDQLTAYENVGWSRYPYENKVTLYSYDGRTIKVFESEVEAYKKVGWHTSPYAFTTLYAPDGRSVSVPKDQVDAYTSLGWYTYPVAAIVSVYPPYRIAVVPQSQLHSYMMVGWRPY